MRERDSAFRRSALPLAGVLVVALVAILVTAAAIYLPQRTIVAASPVSTARPSVALAEPTRAEVDSTDTIAFKCNLPGANGMCMVRQNGSGSVPLGDLTSYEVVSSRESFSPDSKWMVYGWQQGDRYMILQRSTVSGWLDQIPLSSATAYAPVVSPSGSSLAFAVRDGPSSSIHVYHLDRGEEITVTAAAGWHDEHPSWSPDGSSIVFASDRDGHSQLYVAPANGGTARKLELGSIIGWDPIWIKPITQSEVSASRWTPGNPGIGVIVNYESCTIDVSVGDDEGRTPVTRVRVLQQGKDPLYDSGAIRTPLHKTSVVLDSKQAGQPVQVQAWNTGAYAEYPKEVKRVVDCAGSGVLTQAPSAPGPSAVPSPTYIVVPPKAPPGDVFAAATAVAQLTQVARTVGTATPTPLNLVTATYTPAPLIVTATPTPENEGTRAYMAALETAVAFTTGTPTPYDGPVVMATATPTRTNTPAPNPTPPPTVTPIFVPWLGTPRVPATPTPTPTAPIPGVLRGRILFYSDRDGTKSVFVVNPDGSRVAKLTSDWPYKFAAEAEPRSQNGVYLAYVKDDLSGAQVFFHDFLYNADKQVTVMGAGSSWEPAFDPSGARIAFTSNEPGNDEIFVINRDGSGLKRLTNNSWEWDRHPSWSPDGQQIVFWSNRNGRNQLYIMAADGSNVRRLSDGWGNDWDPVWIK